MLVNMPGHSYKTEMKPFFPHTCPSCVYLGSAEVNTVKVDFYVCPDSSTTASMLLYRTGADEGAYGGTPANYVSPLSLFAMMALALYVKSLDANGSGGFVRGIYYKDDTTVLNLNN